MVEAYQSKQEMNQSEQPPFYEYQLSGTEQDTCIDGRRVNKTGPQMSGGTINSIALKAVANNEPITQESVTQDVTTLHSNGLVAGVHDGAHKHPEENRSDCGLSDNLPAILKKVQTDVVDIRTRIAPLYDAYPELGPVSALDAALQAFQAYPIEENVQTQGQELVNTVVSAGGKLSTVIGDHDEKATFINMKPGVTFDRNKGVEKGHAAFNLDLTHAVKEAGVLGVNENFARAGSIILYVATAKVLVEDKGKPRLPVAVHK